MLSDAANSMMFPWPCVDQYHCETIHSICQFSQHITIFRANTASFHWVPAFCHQRIVTDKEIGDSIILFHKRNLTNSRGYNNSTIEPRFWSHKPRRGIAKASKTNKSPWKVTSYTTQFRGVRDFEEVAVGKLLGLMYCLFPSWFCMSGLSCFPKHNPRGNALLVHVCWIDVADSYTCGIWLHTIHVVMDNRIIQCWLSGKNPGTAQCQHVDPSQGSPLVSEFHHYIVCSLGSSAVPNSASRKRVMCLLRTSDFGRMSMRKNWT